MNVVSIKSFWNNGFDKGCDSDKLLVAAKDDIRKLIKIIEHYERKYENTGAIFSRQHMKGQLANLNQLNQKMKKTIRTAYQTIPHSSENITALLILEKMVKQLKDDSSSKVSVFEDILNERERQDEKWGEQNHHPMYWLGILMEEVGELAEATNETFLDNATEIEKGGYKNMRAEAIQVAAVALEIVECLDRNWREDDE